MIGMDRHTGQPIADLPSVIQSIGDILSTPIGSRRKRPEYGSKCRSYVDLPVNAGWKSSVQAEAARAIERWEPRVQLGSVRVKAVVGGKIDFVVAGKYLGNDFVAEVST